jgi:PKD repeat protein
VLIKECKLHNCNDDGIRTQNATYMTVHDCEIYHLLGCGTDKGCSSCNNGHSDGFQIMGTIKADVRRNLVYDMSSTSAFHIHGTCRFAEVYNNIFYGPGVGFPAYIYDTDDIKFNNNVVWGHDRGNWGGLSIGRNLTKFEMYNNIILNINTGHLSFRYDPSQHKCDYNAVGESVYGGLPKGTHDIILADPFTGIPRIGASQIYGKVTAEQFNLKSGSPAINKGITLAYMPKTDYYQDPRTGAPDLGAIERGNSGKKPRVWFTAANREGKAPLPVTFTNESAANYTSWNWDFGEGGSSTTKSPSHTYTQGGKHSVTLVGIGGGLTDTLTVRFYVKVTSGSGIRQRLPDNILTGLCLYPDPMAYSTTFYFASGHKYAITIMNSNGIPVRHLRSRQWDGKDDYGNRLKPGMYLYSVTMDGATVAGKIVKLK